MENKRGLSETVVTLIIILIGILMIGILWVVIQKIVEEQTGEVSTGAKCLNIEVDAPKVVCSGINSDVCDVTLKREDNKGEIGGVKLIFTNSSEETSYVENLAGDIPTLTTKTYQDINTGITNASKLEIVVYFTDDSGKEQLCSNTKTKEF